MTDPPVQPPLQFRETERQMAELQTMRNMLDASAGTFSLSVAVCNSPALRDYLIQRLQLDHGGIEVVHLPRDTPDVLNAARDATKSTKPTALFLTNLEASVPSERESHMVFRRLNASRELWPNAFQCPVVFWLPEYAVRLLSVEARDFWSWKSHQFEFVSEEATASAGIADRFTGDFSAAANLSNDEKRFRIAELEQRIAEAGDPPPIQLAPHVSTWLRELGVVIGLAEHAERAEPMLRKALEIDERLGNQTAVARDLSSLAMIYANRGELEEATTMYEKALEIDERIGSQEGVARDTGGLGIVAELRGDLDQAERMQMKALEVFDALGKRGDMARAYVNLGVIYCRRWELQKANIMFSKALDLSEAVGDLDGMATAYANLGVIYQRRGDLDQAERAQKTALEINERLGTLDAMAADYVNLGNVMRERGDIPTARKYWIKARDLYDQVGNRDKVRQVNDWLAQLTPEPFESDDA